jgi:hypothetical protein
MIYSKGKAMPQAVFFLVSRLLQSPSPLSSPPFIKEGGRGLDENPSLGIIQGGRGCKRESSPAKRVYLAGEDGGGGKKDSLVGKSNATSRCFSLVSRLLQSPSPLSSPPFIKEGGRGLDENPSLGIIQGGEGVKG